MPDITQLSDQELLQLSKGSQQPDITQLSDDELRSLSGQQPKAPSVVDRFTQNPIRSTVSAFLDPVSKTIGGPSPSEFIDQSTKGLKVYQPKVFKAATKILGGAADMATSPATYAAEPLLKMAGKLIEPAIGTLKGIVSGIKDVKDPVAFASNVRNALFAQKKQIGQEFEQGLNALTQAKPNESVDLSDQFYGIKGAMMNAEENPGMANEVNATIRRIKDPEQARLIQNLIEDPAQAKNITLQQSNDIKTAIQNAPSIAGKLQQGKFAQYTNADRELLDLVDEVKLAQADKFPELADVRKPYAEYMNNYRQVKNMFKPASLLTKIKGGFGNEEIDQMVKHVLPEATSKQIADFRNGLKVIKGAKYIGKAAAFGLGGKGVYDLLHGR